MNDYTGAWRAHGTSVYRIDPQAGDSAEDPHPRKVSGFHVNPDRQSPFVSRHQYAMLKRCSEKKDMTEWNDWCARHKSLPILLHRADLSYCHLEGANLSFALLAEANLTGANMKGATLMNTVLSGALLMTADLEGVDAINAQFDYANLLGARVVEAQLLFADLESANINNTDFTGTDLSHSNLKGARFAAAVLVDALFYLATVDGETILDNCSVDENTDFAGVGLRNCRIEPGLLQLLEYNIRRQRWEIWYDEHPVSKWPVAVFWLTSDYGRSTGKVVASFVSFSLLFAGIYYVLGPSLAPRDHTESLYGQRRGDRATFGACKGCLLQRSDNDDTRFRGYVCGPRKLGRSHHAHAASTYRIRTVRGACHATRRLVHRWGTGTNGLDASRGNLRSAVLDHGVGRHHERLEPQANGL